MEWKTVAVIGLLLVGFWYFAVRPVTDTVSSTQNTVEQTSESIGLGVDLAVCAMLGENCPSTTTTTTTTTTTMPWTTTTTLCDLQCLLRGALL